MKTCIRLVRCAVRLRDCAAGNISLFVAFAFIVLVAAGGVAIDFGRAVSIWSRATSAADSALLAAVNTSSKIAQQGGRNWNSAAINAGTASLQTNFAQMEGASYSDMQLSVVKQGSSFTGTLALNAAADTAFMRLFGIRQLVHPVSVAAQRGIPNYIDVHFLVDNSSSMGIGATAADQTIMQNAVGCTVGCHIAISWGLPANYAQVRQTNATLRIDVVKGAIRKFLQDMDASGYAADQVRVSIDVMGNDITQIVAPTTDLNAALNAVDQIDLSEIYRGTNISYSLNQFANEIGPSGDGSMPSQRTSFVVLATDGIENSTDGHIIQPGVLDQIFRDPNFADTSPQLGVTADETVQTIDGNACDSLKAQGQTVLVAHIQYLVPTIGSGDARYAFIQNDLLDKSAQSLSQCASSADFAFMAKASSEIEPVFDQIRQAIARSTNLRLTQ